MRVSRAAALAATFVAFGLAPTVAIGQQVQRIDTAPATPNGKAPMFVSVPSASTPPGCTPTTSLLRFDGGYEVSMCYRTPDGVDGQAKAGLYASAESGLLWFFSRDNAEVLVKVLNGCAINGHRWVFTAPVTTLEFDLWVTSPTGARWNHTNTQGVTAATKSDVAAFACADEPDAAIDVSDTFIASTASDTATAPTSAVGRHGPQTETTPDTPNSTAPMNGDAPMLVPVTSPVSASTTPGCTPTTTLLRFDGGYEVSMCYRTPDTPDGAEGVAGQAKAGLYASAESGLLWFFSRDNAEVLVKVLNGCAINGHRWVFTAPVTTLEFDLWVTSPTGERWTHGNIQGETAATKSDVAAFACADEPEAAPDLVVPDVTVSDATPVAGQTIRLRATVRNRGDGPASPTTLRFYQSGDSTISASDNTDDLLASDAVSALAASATESRTLDFRTPSTPGTFYVGACVDSVSAESRTGNNCSAGVRVVVEDDPDDPDAAPDLIVSGVTVSDATPVAGQTIRLRATVRNRGDGPATPTTLRFYQSSDLTISTTDLRLGADAVPALVASATESRTLDFRTPSTPGTFYVGACVDSVSAESRTGNNCSAGVRVVVEDEPDDDPDEPGATPDLDVFGVTVSDATPVAGQTIRLRATVRNRGDGPATPTTIRYYRSDDSTISASDDFLSSAAVPALAASATETRTLDFRTPSTPGTFYLGACVDSVSAESRTGNNCSAGVQVVVGEPEPAPDLVVPSVTVSDANPAPSELFELLVTVKNRGDSPSSQTTIRYYRSSDSTINTSDDVQIDSDTLEALSASAMVSKTLTVAQTEPITFYLGACIDAVAGESDTENNCSDGVQVAVEEPEPDLDVSSVSVSEANPALNETFQLSVTVENSGGAPSSQTTIRYYRSSDSTINTSDDVQIDSETLEALSASATVSKAVDVTFSSPDTFYLGACIDAVAGESDTENNCSDGVQVVVEQRKPGPDLAVPSVSVSDENPAPNETFQLFVTVKNRGDSSSSQTTLRYYRSFNSTIDTSDVQLGSDTVEALSASATVSKAAEFGQGEPFTFYWGACIDAVAGESDTENNCSAGVKVAVEEPKPGPDLAVPSVSVSDENPAPNETFQLLVTVKNRGASASSQTTIRYYRSLNSTIDTSDVQLGSDTVEALSSLAKVSKAVEFIQTEPFTFYWGACIDAVAGESDTENNCSAGVKVAVE